VNKPRRYTYDPRTLALYTLFGTVGGALVLLLPGHFLLGSFALWAVFAGAAFGGGIGVLIGAILLRVDITDDPVDTRRPPHLPWTMIAVGGLTSVVVTAISVIVNFQTSGFLDGSPCFGQRTETLVPLQYTCLNADGAVALVLPATIVVTLLSLCGAAAMIWGLVVLRRAAVGADLGRLDMVGRNLARAVALFLALDGVLGLAAVIGEASP